MVVDDRVGSGESWRNERGTPGGQGRGSPHCVLTLTPPRFSVVEASTAGGDPGTDTPISLRFSMVLEDGVVKALNVEEDGTGLTCSLANHILSQL